MREIKLSMPDRVTRFILLSLLAVAGFAGVQAAAHAQSDAPAIAVTSPAEGAVITSDDIEVTVKVSNFDLNCANVGRPDEDGVGHIHVMLDTGTMATLTNFYCEETFTISGLGITPGPHTLIIDLSSNTHMDMMDTAQMVMFDYQPTNVRALPEANDQGEPGVELVSDLDGATVSSTFTVEVNPINFTASADLEGKQNVPGYGHYHVFVDTPMGMMGDDDMMASPAMDDMEMSGTPETMDDMGSMDDMSMMSMAGMVSMPGTNTFDLDLSAWGPGTHTIWIEPVQNDHTMFESFGHIEFTVTIEE